MKFCNMCGSSINRLIPEGDNRERYVCSDEECGEIHYQNPRIITGCLPIYKEQILLCRRAIEPRLGLWTLPAGFLENQESTNKVPSANHLRRRTPISILKSYILFLISHILIKCIFFIGPNLLIPTLARE